MSVTFDTGAQTVDMTAIDLADFGSGTVTASSSTEIDVTGSGGVLLYTLIGTGFTTFDTNGFPTDGTVTAFDFGNGHGQDASFTGLSMSATTFMGFVSANDIAGFETTALSGNDHLIGYHGNDVLVGEAGNDNFNLSKGGNDTAQGGAGNDYFELGAAFTAADSIDGGTGSDKVALSGDYSAGVTLGAATLVNVEALVLGKGHDYVLVANDATVASGATLTINAEGLAAANSLNFDGSAEADGIYHLDGGAGNDILTGGAGADTFNLVKGGSDTVHGGGGNDYIELYGTFDASDQIDGGDGNDRIVLNGDYSAGVTLAASTMTNVEAMVLDNGHSYRFTLDDGNLAPGQVLTVNGKPLSATHTLYFDASAETTSRVHISAGAGADTIIGGTRSDILNGGSGNDTIDITRGGSDNVNAGNGDDLILAGGAFSTGDVVQGGSGNDTLVLDGNYAALTKIDRTQIPNVETVRLAAGHDYNLDFNLTLNSTTALVDASALGAGNILTFNEDQPVRNAMTIKGGAGDDVIHDVKDGDADTIDLSVGGDDTVYADNNILYYGAALTANDKIIAEPHPNGSGATTAVLDGDYSAGLTLNDNFQYATAIKFDAGHSYDVTTSFTNPYSGGPGFSVTDNLQGSDHLAFDDSTLDARTVMTITGGTFDVSLSGSTSMATITGGASGTLSAATATVDQTFDPSDVLNVTILTIEGPFTHEIDIDRSMLPNAVRIEIANGGDVKLSDDFIAAGQTFNIVGVNPNGTSASITLDDSAETDGRLDVQANGGDITAGAGNDIITIFGGASTVTGGGGGDMLALSGSVNDIVVYNTVSDSSESGNVLTGMDFVQGFNSLKDEIQLPTALISNRAGHRRYQRRDQQGEFRQRPGGGGRRIPARRASRRPCRERSERRLRRPDIPGDRL